MSGTVAWFSGLSGSGKTSIAERTSEILRQDGQRVTILDGDVVRNKEHRHLGFTTEDIKENNRLIAIMCLQTLSEYDVILVPIISPFRESREAAKQTLGKAFAEVYVRASLEEVMRRDPKGHYQKIREGVLQGFIGVDNGLPYEPPLAPDIVLDTESFNMEECASQLAGFCRGGR